MMSREYVEEAAAARIYGDVHYLPTTMVDRAVGRKIAELTLRQGMRPLR